MHRPPAECAAGAPATPAAKITARYRSDVGSDDLAVAVTRRPGWQQNGDSAVYTQGGAWSARVSMVADPARAVRRWHTAVLHSGTARHTRLSGTAGDAVRWAERLVATCEAPAPERG
jgi:hypothetical protein